MKIKEKWQFRALTKLFSDVNIYKEDFYIVPFEGYGYLTLQYINDDGTIENAILHHSLEALAEFLEENWEFEWLFSVHRSMEFIDLDDGALWKLMPEEVKKEIKKIHKKHITGMKRILRK